MRLEMHPEENSERVGGRNLNSAHTEIRNTSGSLVLQFRWKVMWRRKFNEISRNSVSGGLSHVSH